jgi:hypothetical protein
MLSVAHMSGPPRGGAALLLVVLGLAGGCAWGEGEGRPGGRLGGLGPARTTNVAEVTADVLVLELWLPEGVSTAAAEAAETRALEREAALLALEVTRTKIELGVVEETRWSRGTMTLTEEGLENLRKRGGRVVPGTETRTSISVGSDRDGRPVETRSYTVTVESPAGRHEVAGRPRAEAERHWQPTLALQRAALAALPPPDDRPKGSLEVRERWTYVVASPAPPELDGSPLSTKQRNGEVCRACADLAHGRQALFLSSFGTPGVDPATLPAGTLDAGLEIEERQFVFGGVHDRETIRLERPAGGRLVLRRAARCAGRVVRVEDTLTVGRTADVIAVPIREAHTWHELRDADCVRADRLRHEVFGPPPPPRLPGSMTRNHPARFRVEEHRREIARLRRGEFKRPPPTGGR